MSTKPIILLLLSALCLLFPEYQKAATIDDLMKMSSEQLLQRGSDFATIKNIPDSALMCFIIITERYSPKMTPDEKKMVVSAFNGKWFVYRFLYFDYAKAYENLRQSHILYDELGLGHARLWLNYGCMYQTVSEPSKDPKLDERALGYYLKAFDEALKEGEPSAMQVSLANGIETAYNINRLDAIGDRVEKMKKHGNNLTGALSTEFVLLLFDGMSAMSKGRYDEAAKCFIKQIPLPKEGKNESRFLWLAYSNASKAFAAKKDYASAKKYALEAEKIAKQYDIKDAKIETYSLLGDYFAATGDTGTSNDYRSKYLQIKDTLLNYQQVAGLGEIESIDKINDIEKKMSDIKHESEIKDLWLLVALLVLLLIGAVVGVLFVNNRRLRKKNMALYERNAEMLRAENEAAKARMDRVEKYSNSNLSDDDKQNILDRVLNIMETSPEVLSSEFSAARLAELSGENYKYISQTINECLGKNFSTLLNDYRVKEACKRIDNIADYGNLTIEAIARSVGFASINSFRSAFKRVVGMSPSEYQRIAREKHKAS